MIALAFMSLSHSITPGLASILAPFRALSQDKRALTSPQREAAQRWAHDARVFCPQTGFAEITPILRGRHVDLALEELLECGLMALLLPEVAATAQMGPQAGVAFKDVWAHTKTVVWQSVPSPSVRWAALLHDVGKVSTVELHPDGRVTFMDHERVSFEIFETQTRKRIEFPPDLGDRIAALIKHHQRPSQYEATWSDAAVRRFDRDMGDEVEELLQLSRADITSRRPGRRKARVAAISELSRRIRELRAQAQARDPLPKGFGTTLIQATGMAPGPEVGQLISRLREAVQGGLVQADASAEAYLAYARAQGWVDR